MKYPRYPQDDRIILKPEIPKDKILLWKKDLDRKKLGYSENSMAHPAKMHMRLTQWIIKNMTEKGEIILDPMSGIGSTLFEASRLGRNAFGIEYESKFVEWTRKSIENMEKQMTMGERGKVKVLMGDARQLTDILSEQVDGIISSPPYLNTKAFQDQEFTLQGTKVNPTPRKISEQNYGEVDTVVMSPPFSESQRAGNKDKDKFLRNLEKKHKRKFYDGTENLLKSMHYSDDEDNIGNLKSKNYLSEMKKVYQNCYNVLKLGGKAIIVTKNFSRNYKVVRLDLDSILLMESCGFRLIDRYFRKIVHPSFWIRNYWLKYPNVERVEYEDVLIFQKK